MKTLFSIHPWKLIETELHREDMRLSESLTSLGNAHMGIRGNFEEDYSGDCHRGTYLSGIWVPQKAPGHRCGIACPQYCGRAVNAINLLEIGVTVNGEPINLYQNKVEAFYRELDMERGLLLRRATVRMAEGTVRIEAERFVSITTKELIAIQYRVTPSFPATVSFVPALDANVRNFDSDPLESFWENLDQGMDGEHAYVLSRTCENAFDAPRFLSFAAMRAMPLGMPVESEGRMELRSEQRVGAGETAELVKLSCVDTSFNHETGEALRAHVLESLRACGSQGYGALRAAHCAAWRKRWDGMDVRIDNDKPAQQGIRFTLFQMLCAYDGANPRLSIGSRGFMSEKYGGACCNTEVFCLPVLLSALGEQAGRSLFKYRYLHLEEAKALARTLGCEGALFPMTTFSGEECHSECGASFEKIHRNAAVFYTIFMLREYGGDDLFLERYGLPVMLEICRYWVSRMIWNQKKRRYMILGVTGPNEYETNVQNNWYTNRMAKFCLEKTAWYVRTIIGTRALRPYGGSEREIAKFERIARKIYLPEDKKLGIFLQQDGFLDKEILPASELDPMDRPIARHWSRDRILRSCYINRADTLQGLYLLRHLYAEETIARNFRFYEPLTVHENTLSPCVHAVLAADIGDFDKAVEMYRLIARLDLDNMDNDTEDGLHIVSMCGSWIALVKGFAGVRTEEGFLELRPRVPWAFRSFAFRLNIQGRKIAIEIKDGHVSLTLRSETPFVVKVYGDAITLYPGRTRSVPLEGAQEEPEGSMEEHS